MSIIVRSMETNEVDEVENVKLKLSNINEWDGWTIGWMDG